MTAQVRENIIINDRIEYMYESPSFPEHPSLIHKELDEWVSSCWRGHKGMWRIINNKLYVIDIAAPDNVSESNVQMLSNEPLFAMWYSGTISILKSRGAGYLARDFKVVYEVINGIIEKITAFDNNYQTLNSYKTLEMQEIFKNKDLRAELLEAISNQDRGKIDLLIYLKLDINFQYENSKTPLLMAIECSNDDVVYDLVCAGADVNIADKNGITSLIQAVITRDVEKVLCVLDADNIDFDSKDINGLTALQIALNFYYDNSNDVDLGEICEAIIGGILKEFFDFDNFSKCAEYALINAAEKGDINMVTKLINAGMYLNIQNADNHGETALISSLRTGHIDIAELLIDAGADVNMVTKGSFKLSALTLAQTKGFDTIVSKIQKVKYN